MSAGAGAGAAANIIGGELSGWASVLDKWAMANQYKDEIGRQAGYRDQAIGDFNTRLPSFGSDAATSQIKAGADDRMSKYDQIAKIPLGITSSWQSTKSPGRDAAYAASVGKSRAQLGGYGDWQHKQSTQFDEAARALNEILSFSKGTASVFPYRMYKAQHSNDSLAMLGNAISSIGGAAANYAQYSQGPGGGQGAPGGGANYTSSPNGGGYIDAYGNYWANGSGSGVSSGTVPYF